ncbi:putative benzoyl-CoA reductase, subunit D [delta proteobacterium NaphS2]|nr:putative benzoyl-CoA reductase, subunit D [delta proteobacterium NaphS2]
MEYYGGIDAGSTYIKAAIVDDKGGIQGCKVVPAGIDCRGTASEVFGELCDELGLSPFDMHAVISTGYGRRLIDFASKDVTEIKAHAAGGIRTAPDGRRVGTIIDIGGQDSKVIIIDEEGQTRNFAMNDKCAAGTGRFLDVLSRVLKVNVEDLGSLSLEAKAPCRINSLCAVFAESEVISLLARGKDRADIIAGIHMSLAKRVSGMAKRAGVEPEVLMTGGGALNPGLVTALEDELMMDIHVAENPQLNGAIGAALIGRDFNGGTG